MNVPVSDHSPFKIRTGSSPSQPNSPLESGPSGADGPDIQRMISGLRRRIFLTVAVAILIFGVVVLLTFMATPKYTATTSVMLDPRHENVTNVQAVLPDFPVDTSVMDTEVEILKSRELADRVVKKLGLDQDPEFDPSRAHGPLKVAIEPILAIFHARKESVAGAAPSNALERHEAVVNAVASRVKVSRAGLTYIIGIDFTSRSAKSAALIANTFADEYLNEQLEGKFEATRHANEWLNGRLVELRGQVQDAEAAVEQYKIANNLMSASGATLTEQEISNYNQQDSLARAQLAEDQARLSTARQQLAAGSSGEDLGEALGSEVIQKLREQRVAVSSRVADLQGRYGPRHPELLKAQRELADVDGQIHAEVQRILSNLQAKVQVSSARTGSIEGNLSNARGSLATNNRASVRLRELERNAEAVRSLYESFLNRFKETSSQTSTSQTDAHVVSFAKVPLTPSSPKVPLNLAVGFIMALGAGITASLLAEVLDSSLGTGDDVEKRLVAPYLGSIPLLSSVAKGGRASPCDYVVDNPLSAFAEAFRNLHTSIAQSKGGSEVKVVVVSSSLPSEGKTTTAVALGRSLASGGSRVVIVDCDLPRRGVNRVLRLAPERGLIELLNGSVKLEDVLIQDSATSAMLLPLSKHRLTPRNVFEGPAIDRVLDALRDRFDFIILDTAPVLAIAQTRIIAPKADAVIFLARWRKTPEKAVLTGLKLLAGSGAYIGGVALTHMDMEKQARSGYGDASFYYKKYQGYYSDQAK